LAIDPVLDLKRIGVMNSGDGKKKGAVKRTGAARMIDAEKKIDAMQIKRGFVKKRVGVLRLVVVWMKIVFAKRLATPSALLVSEPSLRNNILKMKLVPEIDGLIDQRCSQAFPSILLPAADPPM
jgi:hypothetical protein